MTGAGDDWKAANDGAVRGSRPQGGLSRGGLRRVKAVRHPSERRKVPRARMCGGC
ncbi:MAG: hypothetical protein KIH01_06990 [Candidatus Freyarchaeota archaeon]|nr:hypothetical protein [Candidatus Jordarchaeia archaeon]